MIADSTDESDVFIDSDWSNFKGIEALKKQALTIDGILFDTLKLRADGTLEYSFEARRNNKFELSLTLKGPIGTPLEVIFIFDKNPFLKIFQNFGIWPSFLRSPFRKKQFL